LVRRIRTQEPAGVGRASCVVPLPSARTPARRTPAPRRPSRRVPRRRCSCCCCCCRRRPRCRRKALNPPRCCHLFRLHRFQERDFLWDPFCQVGDDLKIPCMGGLVVGGMGKAPRLRWLNWWPRSAGDGAGWLPTAGC
jgi:hypothetical protein